MTEPASPVPAAFTRPGPGYYNLTADVKNPKPDKRSNSLCARAVWPAGTLVQVLAPLDDGACGHVYFADHSCVLYGGGGRHRTTAHRRQGDPILFALTPAARTLGVILAQSDFSAGDVLALLFDNGDVTHARLHELLQDLVAVAAGEGGLAAFRRRHNLVSLRV